MEPKIRFKGFEGEWKTEDFQNSFDSLRNNSLSRAELADDGKIANIHYGDVLIKFSECIDTSVDKLTYILDNEIGKNLVKNGALKRGDIIFADAAEDNTVGKCSELLCKDNELIVSGLHTIACRPRLNVAEKYLGYYLNSPAYHNQLLPHIQGTKISSISKKAINTTFVVFPTQKAEQQAIASYFTSLDSQISSSTSRLASLKQMKAASLQAMFPQEGETVPKIRFKGFEGEWRTCVLSSIATMHARIGWQNLRKDEFLSSGDYYLITGTDFHDGKISFETCHYIDKERYDQDKNIQLEIDSILITKDGTLGKVAFVDSLDKPATLNAGIFNVRTKDKEIYPKYLFQYLKAPYLMDYVNKNATGGTIKHLNQNMLVNFPVQYPSYKEQVMIGDYLFNLDRQISLQSQRLEKLKQIKSACLDKMFV